MRRSRLFATVAFCAAAWPMVAAAQADSEKLQLETEGFRSAPVGEAQAFETPPVDLRGSVGIEAPSDPLIPPPDLPPVIVRIAPTTIDVAATDPRIDIAPPDLPSVADAADTFPVAPEGTRVVIAPPDLPDVRVIVEAPPPASAAQLPAHADVAAAIKARLEKDGPPGNPRLTRALRDDIVAFYAARGHQPLWTNDKGALPSARSIAAQLSLADEEGLDANVYALTRLAADADPAALAAFDLEASVAVVIYARDARGGRIDAKRLSNLIDPTIDLPSPSETLQTLSSAANAGAALRDYNPPHPGYRALREKLRELRQGRERVATISIPQGPVLRVGMSDARVALVRERLKVEPRSDTTYDASVAEAVAGFQRERGLTPNGTLTRQTTAALSSNVDNVEADIIANMERWRWLPRDLGERRIVVNIPEFQVRVMDGETVAHQARVIVGKPDTPTPVFSDRMQFLVVNPSWYVPPSILKKEFLPKLASDPTYAERRGYEVTRRGNAISIRQPPGERNALGNIKFMFPNRHAVYLHDTPTRHLFGADRRAFSHGCVRVDQPMKLAEIVLGKDNGWSEAKVKSLIGRGERSLKMDRTLPIHLTYFTSFVDDLGRLQHRDDLYGHNRRVRAALGLNG